MRKDDAAAHIDLGTLAVEIEDQTSWPPDFLDAVLRNRELVLSYQRECLSIDRRAQDDVLLRIHRPTNRHEHDYRRLVEDLETSLTRHRIVGYHCTRLTPGEIAGIKSDGMRLLTSDLVSKRLTQCCADGHLAQGEFDYLRRSGHIRKSLDNKYGKRTGMIWLCPNRSTLRESSGVFRLFQHWGGEVMYGGHENDTAIASTLCRIGTPCIVKCAIPFSLVSQFHINFTERFLSQFVSGDVEYVEPTADFDLYTKHDLPASAVLEIIERSNPKFETMTESKAWPDHHGIGPC
jgi:hypothetical protein